jgi:hypothetical protein
MELKLQENIHIEPMYWKRSYWCRDRYCEDSSVWTPDDWFLASGANVHVTGELGLLHEIKAIPNSSSVTTAGGKFLPVVGHGLAALKKNKTIR